jgi:hypothetical protein
MMASDGAKQTGKRGSGSDKPPQPRRQGGDTRKSQEWGGGTKAGKGAITQRDKQNENSSAKR